MISIIVPVYRAEEYLENCIESLLSQTYSDLEIILVDDGSPDASGRICDAYAAKDSRIRVIHQENRGSAAARNAGLDAASGEYVGFVDADDAVDSHMYEELLRAIYGFDLAICGTCVIRNGKRQANQDFATNRALDEDGLWHVIFGYLNNAVWNKLYRADLIRDSRFPVGICHNEDLLFHLSYLPRAHTGIIIARELYHHYVRPGSVTNSSCFSHTAFDEVKAKDLACEIVAHQYPELHQRACFYCLIARMNVCRKLCYFGVQDQYTQEFEAYLAYIRQHIHLHTEQLPWHRRMEVWLLCHARWLYKLILKWFGGKLYV